MARCDVANGRVGGRRARLLGPRVRELLVGTDADHVALLRAAGWGAAVATFDPAGPTTLATHLDGALPPVLADDAATLHDLLETPHTRRLLDAALALDRAAALKALCRALRHHRPPPPATLGLAPHEHHTLTLLPSPDAIAAHLTHTHDPLGPPLTAALATHRPDAPHAWPAIEHALDRAALTTAALTTHSPSEDARLVRHHLTLRTDLQNAATLLEIGVQEPTSKGDSRRTVANQSAHGTRRDRPLGRARRAGPARDAPLVEPSAVETPLLESPLLDTPLLDAPRFETLARLAPADRVEALAHTLRPWLGPPSRTAAALAVPWRATHLFDTARATALRRDARAHPHSIAVPLAWLVERAVELTRIRLALRGAAFALPPDELLALVED